MISLDPDDPRFWENVSPCPETGCWLWTRCISDNGYGRVWRGPRVGVVAVHRAMIAAPPWAVVMHKCDTPGCINPAHLVIGTQSDNMRDAAAKRRTASGERHGRARLTSKQVEQIRAAYAGGTPQVQIAAEFKCSRKHICHIINHRKWRHAAG